MKQILKKKNAFTLIELLVVIVILGILMAVALPTFLAQQNKAKDSAVKQYLTTAWKAEKAAAVQNQGAYNAGATVVADITASEPELSAYATALTGKMTHLTVACTTTSGFPNNKIVVGKTSTANTVYLFARSGDSHVFALTGTTGTGAGYKGISTSQSPHFSQIC